MPVEPTASPPVKSVETQSAQMEPPPHSQLQPFIVSAVIKPEKNDVLAEVNEKITPASNVVPFLPKQVTRRGRKSREIFGADSIYVDPVQSSKNKWTFRVRWVEPSGKRPILTSRALSVEDYKKLKRNKRNYEAYIKQLIAVCRSRAIRANHRVDRRTGSIS